jgi:hypothetical protein
MFSGRDFTFSGTISFSVPAVPLSWQWCYYLVDEAEGQGKNLLPVSGDFTGIFQESTCHEYFVFNID